MKLYIKQKVFSWANQFTVKDEFGTDKYHVEGEIFTLGHKLHICDVTGTEAALVQQKLFSFMPRYFVFQNGVQTAEIVKQFTLFKPKYLISGKNWTIDGDFWSHNYTILEGSNPVVKITKEWFTWGDSYVLDIDSAADEIAALSVVLAIDCVLAAQDSNHAAGN